MKPKPKSFSAAAGALAGRTASVPQTGKSSVSSTALAHSNVASIPADESHLPRANLSQSVYDQIKADIFEFVLAPGARFSENEIAGRIGVSRTPVREALYRLAREGFLEVHAKSGWTVQLLDFDRFDQLYDVRVIIELAAIGKLCEQAPDDALARLKRAWLVGARARLSDGRAVAQLDEDFHSTLVAATGNAELARIHADVNERIRIVRRLDFTQPERVTRTYDEHAAILRAVLTRKAQQAAMLLRSHIEESKLEVRKISLHRLHLAQRAGSQRSAAT